MNKKIIFPLIILIVVFLAAAGFFAIRNKPLPSGDHPPKNMTSSTTLASLPDTTDWLTYQNEQYGFSLKYPFSWKLVGENVTSSTYMVQFGKSPKQINIEVEVESTNTGESIEHVFQRTTDIDPAQISKSETTIDGVVAEIYHNIPGNLPYTEAYVAHGNYVIGVIQYNAADSDYQQIIGSTKFVSPLPENVSFDACGKPAAYEHTPIYEALQKKAQQAHLNFENISELCSGVTSDLVVFIIPGNYGEVGAIYKFNTSTGELAAAALDDKGRGWIASPQTFGKRNGDVIQMTGGSGDAGCGALMYFDYRFKDNTVVLKKEFDSCADDKTGTWINY